MRVLLWNIIRGVGRLARTRQLKELMTKEKVDVIGVQETIKQDFSSRELEVLNQGGRFQLGLDSCNWTLRGHSYGGEN